MLTSGVGLRVGAGVSSRSVGWGVGFLLGDGEGSGVVGFGEG